MRVLRRRPDGHRPLARLEVRHHPARLHRRRRKTLVDHSLLDDHFCLGKRRLDCRIVDRAAIGAHAGAARHQRHGEVVGKVGVDDRRLAGHRLLDVDDGWQRVVRNDDRIGGVPRQIPILRDDDGDRLAGEPDRVDCDGAVLGRGERRADRHRREEFRDLRAGEHRLDTLHPLGGGGVDRTNPSVRDVAALEREMLHADERDVVDEGRAASDETGILAALDAFADELRQDGRRGHGHLFSTAYWIALTMC
jgi:hypothetical protein